MATTLTQSDIDKLEKALVRGVRTVQYADRTVTYASIEEMKAALAYARNAIADSGAQAVPSTLASFERD